MLQEIWLKKDEHFRMNNYRLESNRRTHGYGGVGILIHESLDYRIVDIGNYLPLETLAIEIVRGFIPITICSVYLPSDRVFNAEIKRKLNEFFERMEYLNGEIIMGGDWNSHHPKWDQYSAPCQKGHILSNLIEQSKFVILNDGSPTCLFSPGRRDSAIDLTLTTPGLASKTRWEVINQEFGSIHLCIKIEIENELPIVNRTTRRINTAKAIENINKIRPQYIYDPNEMQSIFEECLEEASFIVKNKKANFLKKWWSNEINEAYQEKRKCLRTYNNTKSLTNYLNLQRERAKLKRLIRKAKRTHNYKLSEEINENTPSRQLWNMIRGLDTALTQQAKNKSLMTLQDGEDFMKHYFTNKLSTIIKPIYTTKPELEGYEMALTEEEILFNLKKRKPNSAPGEDGVSYAILQKLRSDIQCKISEMLNEVFMTEHIPDKWRNTEVKPIPKQKGNPSSPDSKRPISLMNVNLKLINAVVKDRLNEIIEIENVLPRLSFGFRKHCSSVTCVAYLVNQIKTLKNRGKISVGVFLDMSHAFDSVQTQILINTLSKLSIPNKIVSWLFTYLQNRNLILKTNEGNVTMRVSEGLPQGCPLSPILFNLYTVPLHQIVQEGCELIQFADDLAVLVNGDTMNEISHKANNFLSRLKKVLDSLNLKINASKSAAIVFSKKNSTSLKIKIDREQIEINNTHLYLGYTLDKMLTHRKHIENIRRKGAQKLNLMKILGRRNGNASPGTLIKIGNAIIRSRMDYGAMIYGEAAVSNVNKLQVIQNSYIRYAMRYLKTTPVQVLHAETGLFPIKHRIEWLTIKEILKSTYHNTQLQPFIAQAVNENGNKSYLSDIATKHNDIISQVHHKDPKMFFELRRTLWNINFSSNIRSKLFEHQPTKKSSNTLNWKQHFLEIKNTKYKNFKHIYSDASKTAAGTAIAVFDSEDESVLTDKINNNYSITNAELLAIAKAITNIQEKKYNRTVIFTDSCGACQILNNKETTMSNFLAWQIVGAMQRHIGRKIVIQWIPSHVGIPGNEKVDEAAVETTYKTQTLYNSLVLSDAINVAKKEIWDCWEKEYQEISMEKGKWHFDIMNFPNAKIWWHGLNLNSEEIIILNRIRSGHTLTKERKYQWKWETNECCDVCEEKEDIDHLLYYCPIYNIQRSDFPVLEYCKPLKIICKENNEAELKQIVQFLKLTKIQI